VNDASERDLKFRRRIISRCKTKGGIVLRFVKINCIVPRRKISSVQVNAYWNLRHRVTRVSKFTASSYIGDQDRIGKRDREKRSRNVERIRSALEESSDSRKAVVSGR